MPQPLFSDGSEDSQSAAKSKPRKRAPKAGVKAEALKKKDHSQKSIAELIDDLKSRKDDGEVRSNAYEELGRRGKSAAEAVPALTKRLESAIFFEAGHAIDTLARIGTDEAIDAVMGALKHADWTVRKHAAEELGKLKVRKALGAIEEACKVESYYHAEKTMRAAIEQIKRNETSEAPKTNEETKIIDSAAEVANGNSADSAIDTANPATTQTQDSAPDAAEQDKS